MSDLQEVTDRRPNSDLEYSPSAMRLYGRRGAYFKGPQYNVRFTVDPGESDIALVYGYAYQGHCYTLPEPVFVVLPRGSQRPNNGGCGFGSDYDMWIVEKLDTTVQMQLNADTFEQTILTKNLPGARQPMSYAGKAAMLHRGGKLTE